MLGFERKGSGDCNKDAERCTLCMVGMTSTERQLTGALLRLSGLEDAKSGAMESALMVKDFVMLQPGVLNNFLLTCTGRLNAVAS